MKNSITEIEFFNHFDHIAGEMYRCLESISDCYSGDLIIRNNNKIGLLYRGFQNYQNNTNTKLFHPISIINIKTSNFTTLYEKLDH